MISFKQYIEFLVENRIDFLRNKYRDLKAHELLHINYDTDYASTIDGIINWFSTADPTPNKKYLDWILRQYSRKDFRQEDIIRVESALVGFERFKQHIPQKDINHYYHLLDLEDAVEAASGIKSKREEIKATKHEGADKIFDKGGVVVYKIKTEAAAKFYGAGTKWCTAADVDCRFNTYNNKGPLYVVFCKDEHGKPAKYQFHFESDQLMDEKDRHVNLNALARENPSLKDVPEFQGKKTCLTNDVNFKRMYMSLLINDGTMLVRDPRLTTEQIDAIFTRGDLKPFQAETLSSHPNVTSDIIKKLMQSRSVEIRSRAIRNPKATIDILLGAIKDTSNQVRESLAFNPNITPEILIKLMDDTDYIVRENTMNRDVTIPIPDQVFEKAIKDKNVNVRRAAIEHKNIPLRYIREVADNDKSSVFRALAIKILEKRRVFKS